LHLKRWLHQLINANLLLKYRRIRLFRARRQVLPEWVLQLVDHRCEVYPARWIVRHRPISVRRSSSKNCSVWRNPYKRYWKNFCPPLWGIYSSKFYKLRLNLSSKLFTNRTNLIKMAWISPSETLYFVSTSVICWRPQDNRNFRTLLST
jgi:hypothetical protein